VAVTVAVDNEHLTRILVKRRGYRDSLYARLPLDFEPDKYDLKTAADSALPLAWYEKLMMASSPEQIYGKIVEIDEQVKDMMKKQYAVSQVFVTFDTEHAQRETLKECSMTNFNKLRGSVHIGGEIELKVSEPMEPDTIRWADLDETRLERLKWRLFADSLTLLFIVFDFFFLIYVKREFGSGMFGLAVTGMSYVSFYTITHVLAFEPHESEGKRESSLFNKLTVFRWINTAIMTSYITPFTEQLSPADDSMLSALYAIYFYEILKGPVMQVLDPSGILKKFVLAPFAKDQRSMNSYFYGKYWDLAERYTDMTSIVFLTMYYGIIFPSGFFLCAIALILHYWTDKYCLLRVWARKPALGNTTAQQSRMFIWISIFVFAM
jgi:hypothetical protein